MINLLRSEFFKLRTIRLHIGLILGGAIFVIGVLMLVGIFGSAETDVFDSPSVELAEVAGVASILAGLLVSVVAVLSVSSEFGYGTIRPTLVATPKRINVFVAKALVLAVSAAVIGLLVGVIAYLAGATLLKARGAEDLAYFADDGTMQVLLGIPMLFVLLAMFGYGLGLLIRNSPAAVAVAILWPIVIENVIAAALAIAGQDEPIKFLPYQSSLALIARDAEDFANGRVGGGLYFGVVVAVLVGVAMVANNRRDV